MSPRLPDSFYALGVRPDLASALAERGIVAPFEIQAASLPDSLAGRDVLGRGRTGSGKTVAFALPVVERVLEAGKRRPGHPRALVLVPTRELAVQVAETVEFLGKSVRLRTMTVFGGVRYTGQLRKLERGVDIVVATPGRLEDLIAQGALSLDDVRIVVLDEADLMADMGFLPPVTRVLEALPSGQRLLFSATLDNEVGKLVDRFLTDPLVHSVDADEAAPAAVHYVFGVTHENKPEVLRELLRGGGRTLAFTRTKFAAERLAQQLTAEGIPAVELHGNLRQAARQRNLSSFADGTVSVLVATDIAARGIHVDDVGLVVHIDPPNDPKAFLHRSGRTARAGGEGNVVTLATRNQNKSVRALMAQAKIKATQQNVSPGDAILTEVRAARVVPAETGTSIFEPDPEDAVIDPDERPAREERGGRAWGRDDRPARKSWDRDDRPKKTWGRDDRPKKSWDRDDRPKKTWDREDRPRADRDDRPKKTWDRDDRPKKTWDGDDRPKKTWDREDRPRADRDDRPKKSWDRDDRPKKSWDRDDRPRGDRDDRPARPWDRDDRPKKSWDGDDRPKKTWDREDRPRADRDDRPKKSWDRDERPSWGRRDERPESRGGIEYRPRREPKEHTSGPRGPRPDRGEVAARRERVHAERSHRRPAAEFSNDWWGPEPWQVEDEPRRPARGAQGARGGRPDSSRPARTPAWGREDRRPRPGRDARRDRRDDRREDADARGPRGVDERRPDARAERDAPRESAGARAKNRWSADDRRKAAESRDKGFGYAKSAAKGGKAKAGKAGAGKDKGKPKYKGR